MRGLHCSLQLARCHNFTLSGGIYRLRYKILPVLHLAPPKVHTTYTFAVVFVLKLGLGFVAFAFPVLFVIVVAVIVAAANFGGPLVSILSTFVCPIRSSVVSVSQVQSTRSSSNDTFNVPRPLAFPVVHIGFFTPDWSFVNDSSAAWA